MAKKRKSQLPSPEEGTGMEKGQREKTRKPSSQNSQSTGRVEMVTDRLLISLITEGYEGDHCQGGVLRQIQHHDSRGHQGTDPRQRQSQCEDQNRFEGMQELKE